MSESRAQQAIFEAMRLHQQQVDENVQANTNAIAQLTEAIGKQGEQISELRKSIDAQSQSISRLERAVTEMVAGITAQRGTVDGLIRLCTTLVEQRAS